VSFITVLVGGDRWLDQGVDGGELLVDSAFGESKSDDMAQPKKECKKSWKKKTKKDWTGEPSK